MRPGDATTSEARRAEAAIAAIPRWAGSAVSYRDVTAPVMSPMHRNVDSLCYVVDVDAQSCFLKVVHPELRSQIDVARVFAAAAAAADRGIAPRPLHCLAAQEAIVFERLGEEWRAARVDDLRRPDVMAATIAAKMQIHRLPAFGHAWSVFDGIRSFSLALQREAAVDVAPVYWMIQAMQDIEAALSAAGVDRAPCHADGLACDVMVGPNDAVRLVDFDQACDTDPLYDIGVLLNEAFAFDEEMSEALESYEGRVRPTTLNRCRLYAIADDLYWALWARFMAAATSRTGVEFLKYAQWRFLRCRMALQDPAFERMLRKL